MLTINKQIFCVFLHLFVFCLQSGTSELANHNQAFLLAYQLLGFVKKQNKETYYR